MEEPSIFTRIIRGEVPCHKIYEDEHTLAFLDIDPVQPGHTLVVPKKEVSYVWDLDEETYLAVMRTCQKVARRQKQVLKRAYVGEMIVGTDVPHAHVHIVPFDETQQLHRALSPAGAEPNHEELAKIAERLRIEDES